MGGNSAIEVCQLSDADATRDLGRRLAERLLTERGDGTPPLLLLQGDLGAGKTCLVQGLAEGLGLREPITSPTFALAHHYPLTPSVAQRPQATAALVHLDLYRLDDATAATELFAQEEEEARALGAVLAVEWPERLAIQPRPCWLVELREAGEGREARVSRLLAPPPRHGQPNSRQASP